MIQVSSTVLAAVTMYAVEPEGEGPVQFLQSPQGCILQRVPVDGDAANGWIVVLDYGLDSGSCAMTCTPFASEEPPTRTPPLPVAPVLFHIDDRVKVLVTASIIEGEWRAVNQSFHALFMNYQSNQQELYPVDLGSLPG